MQESMLLNDEISSIGDSSKSIYPALIALILLLLDSIFHRSKQGGEPFLGRQFLALASTAVLAAALIVSPMKAFPKNDYTVGKEPQLYKLRQNISPSLERRLVVGLANFNQQLQRL